MVYKSIGFVTKFENVARRLEFGDIPTPAEGSSVAAEMGGYTRADRTRVPPTRSLGSADFAWDAFSPCVLKSKDPSVGLGSCKRGETGKSAGFA
jgi:hypothetical protein